LVVFAASASGDEVWLSAGTRQAEVKYINGFMAAGVAEIVKSR
jgi:hypothetical protein